MSGRTSRPLAFLALGLWGAFVLMGAFLVLNAPQIWMTERLALELKPGQSVELGRASLGLTAHDRSTAARHLRIERDSEGQWRFFGLSPEHRLDARTDRVATRYVPRLPLSAGDEIRFDGRLIRVVEADDAKGLRLQEEGGDRVHWRDGRLTSEKRPAFAFCRYGDDTLGRLSAWLGAKARELRWQARGLNPTREINLFSLGGQVQCPDRWALPQVPVETAKIFWRQGAFYLGNLATGTREEIRKSGEARPRRLTGFHLPLDGPDGRVNRLVLGRTYFRVEAGGDRMILEPTRNLPVSFAPSPPGRGLGGGNVSIELPPGLSLQSRAQSWVGANPLSLPGPARLALLAILLLLSLPLGAFLYYLDKAAGKRTTRGAAWLSLLPAWTLSSLALLGWGVLNDNLAWGMAICALAWLLATLQFLRAGLLDGMAGLFWLALLFLAGTGALNLAQLAAGAHNSKWLSHASGHLAILTLLAAVAALAGRLPALAWRNLIGHFVANRGLPTRLIKGLGLALVIALIGAQFLAGDEKGLGWIQPVEFVKLTLILMLASALTHLRWMRFMDSKDFRENFRKRIVMALLAVAVFGLATAVVMLGVHDNSPLVIVAASTLPYIWLAAINPLRRRFIVTWLLRGILVLLPLGLVIYMGHWLWHNPPDYLSAIPQADRFRIWSDPWGHRLSGDQVVQSLLRVREGGWTGVTGWFGVNGPVMALPAVQDDFIAALLINRFGGYTALGLILSQIIWCLVLLTVACNLMKSKGGFEEYRSRYWLGAVLFGLVWMEIAHWCISWGNVLGLLPVMGQPMTWLSSGKSHMLAVAFPGLLLGMIGAWILRRDLGERG
ncbi:MAG: FtsW/RodA/SpoVE family cell cycle protein [Gammaproteobacteria bacterium]|nr:FtsW/RodA/SpoVE family cell cycle protein [Gammaproteobacteria bacterium]MBU1653542.1 FtsW/RodA/SpoVE family cell cycle protein [Gammaproteobacteria bacterium]MBU1961884.1 FtsW/RodA/SpoVE family cell cycle protein [Gammaproteobacteria bacterium]